MTVSVRPAGAPDVPGIRRVAEAAWEAAHAPIVGPETAAAFLSEHYAPTAIRGYITDRDRVLLVATDGGDLVGYTMAVEMDVEAEPWSLSWLYVHPSRWGEGIGSRLLAAIEAEIRSRGGHRVALSVMAANDRAVAFYQAAGYERRKTFHDERIDVLSYRYERDLDSGGAPTE